VRADDNVIDRLIVRTAGDTLILGRKPWFWTIGPLTIQARIAMPALKTLNLSGALFASVPAFRGIERLDLELSGASELHGEIEAQRIDVSVSGASRIKLAGSANRLTIEGSGASNLKLEETRVATATVELSGASRASLNVADVIESVEASGASRLRYLGDPRLNHVETSGGSRVARVA
jgi:hypothetical protein